MRKGSSQSFITRAKVIHGEKYDYSLVNYQTSNDKVEIVCPLHGNFQQAAYSHLQGIGCPRCGASSSSHSRLVSTADFIARAKQVHNSQYDYSLVDYISAQKKVTIICFEHGAFAQVANSHLRGNGCSKCAGVKRGVSLADSVASFIAKAKVIHEDSYDYSKVNYVSSQVPVVIVCPKHGDFSPTPTNHLSKKSGCPKCKTSRGEGLIRSLLNSSGLEFKEQATFEACINPITKRRLRFDFWVPSLNTLIEYDGPQHFKPVRWSKNMTLEQSLETLAKDQQRDLIKTQFAAQQGINLLRFRYSDPLEEEMSKFLRTEYD